LKPAERTRRASPLFFHVHDCGGRLVAVVSFLPARYLPRTDERLVAGGSELDQPPPEDLYRPVHDFMDRLDELVGSGRSVQEVTW
jgi:hypothetical protein